MAKFCSNCGTPVKEGDKVCVKCGAVIAGTSIPAKTEGTKKPEKSGKSEKIERPEKIEKAEKPEKQEKSQKTIEGKKKGIHMLRLIVAAIVLIAVAVIAVSVAGNFTGYMGALRTMVSALEDFDMAALEKAASGVANGIYGSQHGDDLSGYYKDRVTDQLDDYEDELGPIKSIRFQVTGESEFSDRRIRQVEEWLEEAYGIDTDEIGIRKIMALDVTLTVKGKRLTEKYYIHDLYLIKERGGWKVYYGTLDY